MITPLVRTTSTTGCTFKCPEFFALVGMHRRSSDAHVDKTARAHLVHSINISQIDEHRTLPSRLQPIEVKRAKLFPFGGDDDRMGARDAVIGALTEGDVGERARAGSIPAGS